MSIRCLNMSDDEFRKLIVVGDSELRKMKNLGNFEIFQISKIFFFFETFIF